METTVLYPQVQPSLECITHNEEQQQQDTSRLCTPNPNVKPSTSISNKLYYRSLDSISPTPKRPKLRAIHSSDTSRFPTLERLENTMVSSKNSKITVEPAAFADNSSSYNMTKGSQTDTRSVHSFTGSIKSINHNRKKSWAKKKKDHQSTPTEIFAKNLSEAVLDVDDSADVGYVYNTKGISYGYPPLSPPTPYDSSALNNDDNSSYFSNHRQNFCRPALRSAVSELPARSIRPFYLESMSSKFEKQKKFGASSYFRCSSSDEEDIENTPLLYYSSSGSTKCRPRNNRRKIVSKSPLSMLKSTTCFWWSFMATCLITIICLMLTFMASPLKSIEVTSFGNVLATQKQLIFNLNVNASNSNSWNIQISHASISLFAASHFVPTSINITNIENDSLIRANTKQEYLGNIHKLEDPLIFAASPVFYFRSKSSVSTSLIQIKNPGETIGDSTGNERWSLLIRYPYELTIRGVVRYQLFPLLNTKSYLARVCKIMQVDPATGIIKQVPLPEQSICDEP